MTGKLCECGCGASIEHLRQNARYLNHAHGCGRYGPRNPHKRATLVKPQGATLFGFLRPPS